MSRPRTLTAVLLAFLISSPSLAEISFDWLVEGPRQAAGVARLDGGYALAENDGSSPTNYMYVRKISAGGQTEWDFRVGTGGVVTGIAVDKTDNIYVVGHIGSAEPNGTHVDLVGSGAQFLGTADAFVISLTSTGVRRFTRLYGTTGDENFFSIAVSGRQVFFGGWVQAAYVESRDDVPLPGGSTVRPQEQTGVVVRMSDQGEILGETVLSTGRQDGTVNLFPFGIQQLISLPDGGVLANGSFSIFRLRQDGSVFWVKELPDAAFVSIAKRGESAWALYFDDPDFNGFGASLARLNLDTGDLGLIGGRGSQSTGTLWGLPGGRLAVLGRKDFGHADVPALRFLDGEGVVLAEMLMSTAPPGSDFHNGLADNDTSSVVASVWFGGSWGLGKFTAYRPYLATALTDIDGFAQRRSPRRLRIKAGSMFSLQWKVVSVLGADVGFRPELQDAAVTVSSCGEEQSLAGIDSSRSGPSYLGNGVWKLKLKSSLAWRGSCRQFAVSLPDGNRLSYVFDFH